jgi:hypothetical protein
VCAVPASLVGQLPVMHVRMGRGWRLLGGDSSRPGSASVVVVARHNFVTQVANAPWLARHVELWKGKEAGMHARTV